VCHAAAQPELPAAHPRCRAIWYGPDGDGIRGVYLGKNVVTEAGAALAKVMRSLAPRWVGGARLLGPLSRLMPHQLLLSLGLPCMP
jgi:hypothetical protein